MVAAPIRNECVDIGDELQEGKAWLRMVVSRLRNVPLEYVNNGPDFLQWHGRNFVNASTRFQLEINEQYNLDERDPFFFLRFGSKLCMIIID